MILDETAEAIIIEENNEPSAVVVELPESEPERGASEVVQIEEVRAERDITIAALEHETEIARLKVEKERNEAWQEERVAALEASNLELREQNRELKELTEQALAALHSQSSPIVLSTEPALESETPAEQSLTPQSIAEPETAMETGPSEEDEKPAEAGPSRKRRRLI